MTNIRKIKDNEIHFLTDMLYECVFVVEGEDRPSIEELLRSPHLMKYVENWGGEGDAALVAFSDDTLLGAVWYRLFKEDSKGYGFVDEQTPEISMALLSESRGKGIGTSLLKEIIQLAKSEGFKGLSLSVDPENKTALRMYERFGFLKCGEEGTSWTMKLSL